MGSAAEEKIRICSLLPGATEVVAALGSADRLVGISHECDWPPEVQGIPIVVRPRFQQKGLSSREMDRQVSAALAAGHRLYELDETALLAGRPTVILTQDLCSVCAVTPDQLARAIAALPSPPSVLNLHATSLDDVVEDVARIGQAIGRPHEGEGLAASLRTDLQTAERTVEAARSTECRPPRAACVEWLDPPYVAGHWVPEMVAKAGGVDALGATGSPSRRATWKEIADADPDILLLMPCGYTVDHILGELSRLPAPPEWDRLRAVRNGQVFAVNASAYFSRPGPRLIQGVRILASLCHPQGRASLRPGDAAPVAWGTRMMGAPVSL